MSHFGMVDELDVLASLAGIELVLTEMGHEVTLGTAVAAASRVFVAV